MPKTIRWGVLSTANHGAKTVIPAIQASQHGMVTAIASRDASRAQAFAASLGIPTSYGSYEVLLADPDVDAVYIPLPNTLHKEWAIRALQAGKHVLCEKPLALNAAEAAEMVAAAHASGRHLAEAFQWRHHPQGQRMRELIGQGAIGTLRLIDAGFSFPLTEPGNIRWVPDLGGGALYDLGCYPISFARYIAGEPRSVTAQIHWGASGVDDLVVATLEFPNDVLCHINCSFILPLSRYYEAQGTKGFLSANKTYNPRGEKGDAIKRATADREVVETYRLPRRDAYVLMADDFNTALLEGREMLFPPEDGLAQMRVIDAIFQSARGGRRVDVAH